MPFSSSQGKGLFEDWLFHMLAEKNITSILDVGAGAGAYINCIEIAKTRAGVYSPKAFDVKVDALEPFAEYVGKYDLGSKYNKVMPHTLAQYLLSDDVKDYDLIILGDVAEHMEKEEVVNLIRSLLDMCKFVWVSLPINKFNSWTNGYDQGEAEWEHNPLERHLYSWDYKEFFNTFADKVLGFYPFPVIGAFLLKGAIKEWEK